MTGSTSSGAAVADVDLACGTRPTPRSGTLASPRHLFEARGFVGPVPVVGPDACRELLRRLAAPPPPADWAKGHGASSPDLFEVATLPAILDRVVALLGDDVLLWGVSTLRREPGHLHPWHTDLESSAPEGRTVSVWIGLENTSRRTGLRVIPGSHRYGVSIQELLTRGGRGRDDADDAEVETLARQLDPQAAIEVLDGADGEAVFFDGRLWHGSHNLDPRRTRRALLLQFATPETLIRMPDPASYGWPFHFYPAPEPPCVMVHGTGLETKNRIVPPPRPSGGGGTVLSSCVRSLDLPLAGDPLRGWKPYKQFSGTTPCLRKIGCHVSVLSPGHSPHPPHRHVEEELLVVLDGEAELVLPDVEGEPAPATRRLSTGSFVYYPAWRWHTLRNVGGGPVTYLMFKWVADESETSERPLETRFFDDDGWDAPPPTAGEPESWAKRRLVKAPTRFLRRLAAHVSVLAPGVGYPPHADAHDVAILIRRGEVETMGHRVGPGGIVFYAAGEAHDMRNVGTGPASYLVFEFHGARRRRPPAAPLSWKGRLASSLPRPLEKIARRVWRSLRRRR